MTATQPPKLTVDAVDFEAAVLERYQEGARAPQPSLCCPTSYEPGYLDIIPEEIIAKDYGCGDPTRYVGVGETVLDLGSGAGKNCYIIAQKVGATGRVIGVDFNDEMLELARRYRQEVAGKLGYANVEFVKGKIQDLKLDLDKLDAWLQSHPVASVEDLAALEAESIRLRSEATLIPNGSIDTVVSNCVLNLVKPHDKWQLFEEIFRALKPGGSAVISDIVCDREPTPEMIADPELWSGCLSGAYQEVAFLTQFADVGFSGIEILQRQAEPWQVVGGIEFRSLTVRAWKAPAATAATTDRQVIYKGPWQEVVDERGGVYRRGEITQVSAATCQALLAAGSSPYAGQFIALDEASTDAAAPKASRSSCCG